MTAPVGFEIQLAHPYQQAIDRVTEALKSEGFGILTRIDVHTTFKEKLNEEFRPYVILGACNPPIAHRALQRDPRVGLLMPCNVTVEAAPDGGSLVRIGNPELFLTVGELGEDPEIARLAQEVRGRLDRVVQSLESVGQPR
jgi:uncharacterized protein (DUF302 family)